MRTHSEPTGRDDRDTTLDVATPPAPPAGDRVAPRHLRDPAAPAAASPTHDGAPTRPGRGRGRHRAARPWPSRRFLLALGATMIAAGALGGVATVALSVPWLWPRAGAVVRHRPDTVLATVLLAASLAAVWRMSGPRPPRGPHR